jgi:hypothetical protein
MDAALKRLFLLALHLMLFKKVAQFLRGHSSLLIQKRYSALGLAGASIKLAPQKSRSKWLTLRAIDESFQKIVATHCKVEG